MESKYSFKENNDEELDLEDDKSDLITSSAFEPDDSTFNSSYSKLDERVQQVLIKSEEKLTEYDINSVETSTPKENSQENLGALQRKYVYEDISHPNWPLHNKHIFVLSSAGKPIYSRYGDEQNLAPFMASLIAMISFVSDMGDTLRYINAGNHTFIFLVKGPIALVCASKTREPIAQLTQQLNYVYSQVISILTAGVNQIFERRAHFDLRSLLGGADKFLDSLVSLMDHDFSYLLNSIHCLRLDSNIRSAISSIIQSAQTPDLLYAILTAKHQLVNLIRPKKYILQPSDLHLIMNFVNGSTAFRASESWTPLCLPKFNDSGFLHAYVCFVAPDVCLLLISTKQDSFYELSNAKSLIIQGLNKTAPAALDTIAKALEHQYYSVSELKIPSLLHFLYKSKSAYQFTCPRLEAPYITRSEQKRLFRIYQRVHKKVHRFKKAHKVYYQVSQSETIVGWVTSGFELYATFGPLESKPSCIKACNEILKWIKNEESSLFILNAPIW